MRSTNWQQREAQAMGELSQSEALENEELNRKARAVRAENIRRVALANRNRGDNF